MQIDQTLIKHFNLTLQQIDDMTITEIVVYLDALQEKSDPIPALAIEQAAVWNKLTPAQKLVAGYRQYGNT